MVMIVLAVITLLIIVLSLTTDIPALQTASQNIYVLIGVFVSSGGLGGWLLKVANNAHKIAVLHLVLDEVMARPVGRGNDKLIQDILTKLP
jgi:hypothetical protein